MNSHLIKFPLRKFYFRLKRSTMDLESWQTASSDVKQSIISRADPSTVRSFCQADRNSREICRDRLHEEVKFRSCLDSKESARECDRIPMFSKQQFLKLIPPQIKIFPDDPLQFTHEFYSQKYKLPNEGFSEALRKAKIINTLCALIRPNFLFQHSKNMLPLPAYVDADFVDRTITNYINTRDEIIKTSMHQNPTIDINITATSSIMPKTDLTITITDHLIKNTGSFDLSIFTNTKEALKLSQINDPFIAGKIKVESTSNPRSQSVILKYKTLQSFDNTQSSGSVMSRIIYDFKYHRPNTFLISRIIYDLLNKGFDTWTIFSVTL